MTKNIVVDIQAFDTVTAAEFDAKALAAAAFHTGTQDAFAHVLQLAARITLVCLADAAKNTKTAIQVRLGLMRMLGSAVITNAPDFRDSAKQIEVWTYDVANGRVRVKFYADDIEFIFIANK